jgi:hypothetical protein
MTLLFSAIMWHCRMIGLRRCPCLLTSMLVLSDARIRMAAVAGGTVDAMTSLHQKVVVV